MWPPGPARTFLLCGMLNARLLGDVQCDVRVLPSPPSILVSTKTSTRKCFEIIGLRNETGSLLELESCDLTWKARDYAAHFPWP